MKRCFKCDQTKPLDDFYRHPMMADGHLNKCKECAKRDVREHRAANAEYFRQYDRRRFQTESRRASHRAHSAEQRRRDPLKRGARIAVCNAIRNGALVRKPCEVCGGLKAEAHHDDYSKPLEVRWLCKKHHTEHHWQRAA